MAINALVPGTTEGHPVLDPSHSPQKLPSASQLCGPHLESVFIRIEKQKLPISTILMAFFVLSEEQIR